MRWLAGYFFIIAAFESALCAGAVADDYYNTRTANSPAPRYATPQQSSPVYPHTNRSMSPRSASGHAVVGYDAAAQSSAPAGRPAGTSASTASGSLRLPRQNTRPSGAAATKPQTPTRTVTTIVASLAIVLGAFFLVVWLARRALPQSATPLPKEVIDVLGRASFNGRQQMQVVRFGNKLLLVSVTPTGLESLSEITDPDEVDRIAAICQQNKPDSISATFRQVLAQLSGQDSPDETADGAASEEATNRHRRAA